jgi:hypothetical protein
VTETKLKREIQTEIETEIKIEKNMKGKEMEITMRIID